MSTHVNKKGRSKMFWILVIASGLVSLVAAAVVAGLLLPETYHGRIEVAFDRPADAVWSALADYRRNPVSAGLNRGVESRPDVAGQPAWVEDLGSTKLDVTTLVAEPPRLLRRQVADRVVPMTAQVEYRIEPTPGGCRVIATNRTVIRRGTWHVPIFRLMMKLTGAPQRSLRDFFTRLAANLAAAATFDETPAPRELPG